MSGSGIHFPSKNLGEILRRILRARGYRQDAIAKRVGITPSNLSNILTGKARPRQLTLTRLIEHLQPNPEELQAILAAYDRAEISALPIRPTSPETPTPEDEKERVKRYLELKAKSVAFEERVQAILADCGFPFQHHYREGAYICDFYLPGPPRIAIECKANIGRDWDRTVTTANLLLEELPCEEVLIVVPESQNYSLQSQDLSKGCHVCSLDSLKTNLKRGSQ